MWEPLSTTRNAWSVSTIYGNHSRRHAMPDLNFAKKIVAFAASIRRTRERMSPQAAKPPVPPPGAHLQQQRAARGGRWWYVRGMRAAGFKSLLRGGASFFFNLLFYVAPLSLRLALSFKTDSVAPRQSGYHRGPSGADCRGHPASGPVANRPMPLRAHTRLGLAPGKRPPRGSSLPWRMHMRTAKEGGLLPWPQYPATHRKCVAQQALSEMHPARCTSTEHCQHCTVLRRVLFLSLDWSPAAL
jgi:hypothetical protein